MKPLHVALLTHSVRPRGGVVHTLELADALAARRHRVTVIASAEPGESLFRAVSHELALIRLPVLTGNLVDQVRQRIATLTAALPELLRRHGPDLVHAQDSLSGNALASLRECGQLDQPWLRTVHHLERFEEPLLNQWQDRAWHAADGVACVSDEGLAPLRRVHGKRVERMLNGVNLQRFQAAPQPGDEAACRRLGLKPDAVPLCLLVGGVEGRKNSVRLLQAFAQLRRDDPAWAQAQLVVAGGASMLDHAAAHRAWQQSLAEFGLEEGPQNAVLRTGPLADDLLPPLMRRATLLAMPSLVEGFGLVALEALACGTPVLVSERPPFTEHLRGCESVAWCDPEHVPSIAAGLRRAARLPRPQATPRVCLDHSWARSAERHEAWYRRTLN